MLRLLRFAAPTIVMVAIVGPGCSLIVSFDEEMRPCGPDEDGDRLGDCLAGYSCMINQCVADGSVARGHTCTVSAHCAAGDVCAVPGFVCRQSCAWAFGDGGQCDSSTLCVAANDFYGAPIGACVDALPPQGCATACTSSVGPTPACVQVKPNLGRCMTACALTCLPTGCSDGCDGYFTDDVERSCQPVGPNQNLVCVPSSTGTPAPVHGEPCNLLNQPCAKGFACIVPTTGPDGVCRAYCQEIGDTRCSEYASTCATVTTLLGETFGVCQ